MTIFLARRTWSIGLLALAVSVFNAQTARAANITINDALADETITISWSDFFYGFSVNGVEFADHGSLNVPEGVPLFFEGGWLSAGDFLDTWAGGINFLEPDGVTLSDVFQYEASLSLNGFAASISGSFASDDGHGPPLQPVQGLTIIEDGTPYVLAGLPALPYGLTIQIQSDGEAQVPEPTSILLLGTGLVAAARFRRAHGKR